MNVLAVVVTQLFTVMTANRWDVLSVAVYGINIQGIKSFPEGNA